MTDTYQIKVITTLKKLPEIEAVFEEMTTTSSFVLLPRNKIEYSAYMRTKPPKIKGLDYEVIKLEKKNWLKESLISFPPLTVGKFYVYGTHIKKAPPKDLFPVKVDAATAFGSGEHGTTKGCLRALSDMKEVCHVLDVGTGTGILAIAAKKMFPKAKVLASDIDPESVRVSKENAKLNDVKYKTVLSDGFKHKDLNQKGGFDLVFANILAGPLIEMAKDLFKVTAKDGGRLVISGLLKNQKKWVREEFEKVGFTYKKSYDEAPWSAMLLIKQ